MNSSIYYIYINLDINLYINLVVLDLVLIISMNAMIWLLKMPPFHGQIELPRQHFDFCQEV